MPPAERGATPPGGYAAFGAVWFCYFAAIGLFNPYAPLWFKELGLSTLAIGALASLQSATRIVAPYGWGWLGDRSGRRAELLRWAAVAALLAALLLSQALGLAWIAVCTALLFVANGGIVPLAEAALSQRLSAGGTMDHARYGRVRMWGSLGFVAAVLAFGALLEAVGLAAFPWFVVAMFAALVVAATRLRDEGPAATLQASAGRVRDVLRRPEVAWFFVGLFLTVLAHTSLYAFFSLYLDELGYGKGAVGVLWAVAVLVEVVAFWTQGRWFARVPPMRWLQWAALATALRFALMAQFGGWAVVLVLTQSLHALTFAAQHAACIAWLNEHFPGQLRGRGQALYTTLGYGVSGVVGGLAGGWISGRFGFGAVFWIASLAGLAAWLALARARAASAR